MERVRRVVLVLPKLLGEPNGESVLGGLANLARLAERAELVRLASVPRSPTPEAAFLGLDPREVRVAQGPLLLAAFRCHPPEGAIGIAADLFSCIESRAQALTDIPADDLAAVLAGVRRLETASLRFVEGQAAQHALVWLDGSHEVRLTPAAALAGEPIEAHWPEGDGVWPLRRLIDDSVNLLTSLEVNRRREDEGLAPINLLWPWGAGPVMRMPSLVLEWGEPAVVVSGSLRIMGLCRGTGLTHAPLSLVRPGVNQPFAPLLDALRHPLAFLVYETPGRLRASGRLDEAEWVLGRFDAEFLGPLMEEMAAERSRLVLLAPGFEGANGRASDGLGAWRESHAVVSNSIPFDERALEEPLGIRTLWNVVGEAVRWSEE